MAQLLLLLGAFSGAALARDPVDVEVVRVEAVTVDSRVEATGTIAAHKTTDILPIVGGLVEAVHVSVGDRVDGGDPLFTMRTIELALRRDEQRHGLALARAELRDAEADLERNRGLAERRLVPLERVADLEARRDVARAQVGIAETRLAAAEQVLEDAVVRAPFRGVVTARGVDEGAFIETRGMMRTEPAIQLMKVDVVAAIVMVPETHVDRIRVGTPAVVRIDGLGADGHFESIAHIVNDRVDHESRSFEVRVGIANEDYRVKPGLFCRVTFTPPAREVPALPRSAIRGSGEQSWVFVEENGVARRRPLVARELDAERVQVVSGLAVGDAVLTGPGVARLAEGMAVRIARAGASRPAALGG
ncbi:MAG: efflux RND transporter periplasmic adaptor subunit [Pseudomonadales bacterium]|nr:efflux RND transporter periplasmic adaptor subunit [Pseudomonadales bacterium]